MRDGIPVEKHDNVGSPFMGTIPANKEPLEWEYKLCLCLFTGSLRYCPLEKAGIRQPLKTEKNFSVLQWLSNDNSGKLEGK